MSCNRPPACQLCSLRYDVVSAKPIHGVILWQSCFVMVAPSLLCFHLKCACWPGFQPLIEEYIPFALTDHQTLHWLQNWQVCWAGITCMHDYSRTNGCRVTRLFISTATDLCSMQTWCINTQKLKTLADLHSFIHTEHTCYSVAHQVIRLAFARQCTPCWQVVEDLHHWMQHNEAWTHFYAGSYAIPCTPLCNASSVQHALKLHIAQLANARNFDVAMCLHLQGCVQALQHSPPILQAAFGHTELDDVDDKALASYWLCSFTRSTQIHRTNKFIFST